MDHQFEIEPRFRWNRDPVVLLVDDEPGVLSAVRRAFRNEPYDVITAASCDEALAWLEELPVDLLITDQEMPRMSGRELLDVVRTRFPRTARALLTGRLTGPDGGTDPILFKTWDDGTLVDTVRHLLEKGAAQSAGI